jgi:hypothetical protein
MQKRFLVLFTENEAPNVGKLAYFRENTCIKKCNEYTLDSLSVCVSRVDSDGKEDWVVSTRENSTKGYTDLTFRPCAGENGPNKQEWKEAIEEYAKN